MIEELDVYCAFCGKEIGLKGLCSSDGKPLYGDELFIEILKHKETHKGVKAWK